MTWPKAEQQWLDLWGIYGEFMGIWWGIFIYIYTYAYIYIYTYRIKNGDILVTFGVYPLVSSNMVSGTSLFTKWRIFPQAMFDDQRIWQRKFA